MRLLLFCSTLLSASVLWNSCATTAPDNSRSATVADGVDFKNLRTYEWLPDAGDSINNLSIFDNQILRNRMHRAIEQEMKQRGVSSASSSPDMRLQMVVQGKGGMQVTTQTNNNSNYPYNNRYPYNSNTTTTSTPNFVQHRVLILNGYDRNKNLLFSLSLTRDYKDAGTLQKNIEKDIAALMSNYPIKI
jgi:hypothetical protein